MLLYAYCCMDTDTGIIDRLYVYWGIAINRPHERKKKKAAQNRESTGVDSLGISYKNAYREANEVAPPTETETKTIVRG